MATGSASGSASAAGEGFAGVANPRLRPARQQPARARGVPAPVQPQQQQPRQMPNWMSFLPEATKSNAHLLIIWPALDVEDGTLE